MTRQQTITRALQDSTTRSWWLLSLYSVSLDRVRPHWEAMDLRFQHPQGVLEAIRGFVVSEAYLNGNPDSLNYGRKVLTLTRTMFKAIRAAEGDTVKGDEAVQALWNWFQVNCDEEPKWHWMWRILLYHLPSMALTLPRVKASRLGDIADRFADLTREAEIRVDHLQLQPKSSWDSFVYQCHAHDESGWNPLLPFEEALERIAFDRAWAEVVTLLSPREMEVLVAWGRQHAAEIDANKDEDSRKNDQVLGPRALQVRDAIIPAEYRMFQ